MGSIEGMMKGLTLDGDKEEIQNWVYNAMNHGGDFLKHFAEAAARADWENYLFLRPVITVMMEKYPEYKTRRPA